MPGPNYGLAKAYKLPAATSSEVPIYSALVKGSSVQEADLPASLGDLPLGVLYETATVDDIKDGRAFQVRVEGSAFCIAGEAIADGDIVVADTDGTVLSTASGNGGEPGEDTTFYALGIARSATTEAGQLVVVQLQVGLPIAGPAGA